MTTRNGSGALLSTHGLYKAFGGNVAVHDVSLDLYPDRITALIGPNGAGKTTLFNIVTGYERADAGEITFDGRTVTGMAPWEISRRGVVRTFQTPVGFPTMTVWESLQVAGASHNVLTGMMTNRGRRETAELSERVDGILQHLGLILIGAIGVQSSFPQEAGGDDEEDQHDEDHIEHGRQIDLVFFLLDLDVGNVSSHRPPLLVPLRHESQYTCPFKARIGP